MLTRTQYTEIVVVTPALAEDWLRANIGNRRLRESHVADLAGAMLRGEWRLSHQGVAFASNGSLIDGQHRLRAVIRSGVAVPMTVTRNVDPDAFVALDRGAIRSHSDILNLNTRNTAACRMAAQMLGARNPSTTQIQHVAAWLMPTLHAIDEAAAGGKRDRSSASVRLACAGRVLQGAREHALRVWKAFVTLDIQNIPSVGASLLRQLDSGEVSPRKDPLGLCARAWVLFDPARADVSKLQIKNMDVALNELRLVLATAAETHGNQA